MKRRGDDGSQDAKERISVLRDPNKGTFSIVPIAAARDRRLGRATAVHVLMELGKYRNSTTGECYPAIATMADSLGITGRSVQRHLNKLIMWGYVIASGRVTPEGGWSSNDYILLYPPSPGQEKSPPDAGNAKNGENPALEGSPSNEAPMATAGYATLSVAYPSNAAGMQPPPSQGKPLSVASPCDTQRRINDLVLNDPFLTDSLTGAEKLPTRLSAALKQPIATAPTVRAVARQRALQIKPRSVRTEAPRNSLEEVVRWAAKRTGMEKGLLWAKVIGWHEALEKVGLTNAEAEAAIVRIGRRVQFATKWGDPIQLIEGEIQALLAARQGGTAAA